MVVIGIWIMKIHINKGIHSRGLANVSLLTIMI